jgi:penicillin V acylase-like amidase (Ntn superfamily)
VERVVLFTHCKAFTWLMPAQSSFFLSGVEIEYLACGNIFMKRILVLLFLCLAVKHTFACTTFCINKNGQIVFGRNYDWVTGAGIVNTNQRGLFKASLKVGNAATISWISAYGSITFNQYGKEFPTGGMNEKGLVVEQMWLDGTRYPASDSRPAMGVLQWLQYQLDNAATVAEVISSDTKIRIDENDSPLHYLVADAAGNVATIEFIQGKMRVHKEKELPFPVLTNDTYASSVQTAKPIVAKGSSVSLNSNSLDRFVKACSMVKKFNETKMDVPVTDFAFSILDKVAQVNYTKWSIVYDISNKKIHFKTDSNRDIKTIEFSVFDFACNKPATMFNMNQDGKGDISKKFILSDKKIKQQVLHQAVTESRSHVTISKKEEAELLDFETGVSCKL